MKSCSHAPHPFRICEHLLFPAEIAGDEDPPGYRLIFAGSDYTPMCEACAGGTPVLAECCDGCRLPHLRTDTFGVFDGFGGTQPEPRVRDAGLVLVSETVDLAPVLREKILALAPIPRGGRAGWLVLTESWRLVTVELPSGNVLADLPAIPAERLPRPPAPDPNEDRSRVPHPRVIAAPDGRFAAVLLERTRHGVVVDLASGSTQMLLDRGDYHPEVSGWPFAFFERDGRTLAVHAIGWNRLAVTDVERGETLTAESEEEGQDYFLGKVTLSPSATRLATAGWVWQPVGILRTIRLDELLEGKRDMDLEMKDLNQTGYHWDGPNVWLDEERILFWGLGDDDRRMVDAGVVFDVKRFAIAGCVPGLPYGELALDGRSSHVWSCGSETSVWDAAAGERIARVAVRTNAFHPTARHAAGLLDDGRISLVFLQRT